MTEDTEINVLATMFLDPGAVAEVQGFLQPKDFIDERHRLVYSSIVYMATLGEPVSPITVRADLARRKKLTAAGGVAYIESIRNYMADATSIMYYARMVKAESIRRELGWLGQRLQNCQDDPVTEANYGLERLVEITSSSTVSEPKSVSSISQSVLQASLEKSNGDGQSDGVPTGFPRLDGVLLYLQPKSLYLVAARPSIGKSALVTNFSVNAAKRGNTTLFISLEMTDEQLTRRILSMESGVAYERIMGGNLTKSEQERLIETEMNCRNLPILIDDNSSQSIADIRAKARRQQAKGKLDLIIIDYLQLAAADPNDFKMISAVGNGLKAIAKDLKLPVIGVSQLSRNVEHREGGNRPCLSDLRGSGQLEQDADCVLSIYKKRHSHMVEILKNRNGGCGPDKGIEFSFDNNTTVFTELGVGASND